MASQDSPAADEISARLNRFALDEVDRAPEKFLQLILKLNQCAEIVSDSRLECHEEVGIAAAWIEITTARSRTKDLQAGHAMAAADSGKGIATFDNVSLGGHVRSCLKLTLPRIVKKCRSIKKRRRST